jgi:hypothetical protein
MVLLFHTVAALFLLLVDSVSSQKYELNIRDNGKICTQWIKPVGGQFSLSYSPQQECTSGISVEQANGQARLCCQGMPVTTPSTNFSRECGKQAYQPLKQRIIGGLQARPNSWVSVFQSLKKHGFSKFPYTCVLPLLSHGKSCYMELAICVVVLSLMHVMS